LPVKIAFSKVPPKRHGGCKGACAWLIAGTIFLARAARKVHDSRRIKGRDFLSPRGKTDEFYEWQDAII